MTNDPSSCVELGMSIFAGIPSPRESSLEYHNRECPHWNTITAIILKAVEHLPHTTPLYVVQSVVSVLHLTASQRHKSMEVEGTIELCMEYGPKRHMTVYGRWVQSSGVSQMPQDYERHVISAK